MVARYFSLRGARSCLLGVLLAGAFISNEGNAQTAPHSLAPMGSKAPLSLTCYGDGEIRQVGGSGTTDTRKPTYHGHVELRLFDGNDRIQLPPGFRPGTNPRDDGWYKVKNLKMSEDDVIGNAAVSFIDKPFFRVALVSGRLDISGLMGTFVGECRRTGT